MSTDPYVDRIVRSWLEVGVTALPDRVLDVVIDQLPATPQRRSWWPARRIQGMNHPFKFAFAATAAAVLVAVLAFAVLPKSGGVGASPAALPPTAVPTPTSTPETASVPPSAGATPAASAAEIVRSWPGTRENPAGRYSWDPDLFDWQRSTSLGSWMHSPQRGLQVWFSLADVGYGPGPIARTVGGYDATYQTLTPTAEGAVRHVWIVDFEGKTVSITVEASAGSSAVDLADANAIIDSIRLERTSSSTGFRLTFDLETDWDSG